MTWFETLGREARAAVTSILLATATSACAMQGDPTDDMTPEEVGTVQSAVTTVNYDFIANAAGADWSNEDGEVDWKTNDARGGCYKQTTTTESGTTASALFTVPKSGTTGKYSKALMQGGFWVTIPAANLSPTLTVTFGFKQGATGTDGVTFKIFTQVNGSTVTLLSESKTYTGQLATRTIDLSPYGGTRLRLFLIAKAGTNANDDLAIWTKAQVSSNGAVTPIGGCTYSGGVTAEENQISTSPTAGAECFWCNPVEDATAETQRPNTCFISSTCYAAGEVNPSNSCQVCDPSRSRTSFSTADTAGCVGSGPSTVTIENYDGTALGTIQGAGLWGTNGWFGVPYAAAPTGSLRFAPPAKATAWSGTRNTKTFAPACPQPPLLGTGMIGSEDCLYLNIWAPKTGSGLPVFVFQHGGAHMFGGTEAASDWLGKGLYSGARFAAAQDAVVVTIQTRIGVLGFLADPALSLNATSRTSAVGGGTSGNYGLLDAIQALKWVKRNISKFGGDPNKVTFSGQSSGATVVCDLLASPLAKDPADNKPYFSSVIMESGFCESPPTSYRYQQAATHVQNIGCASASDKVACLRAASLGSIVATEGTVLGFFNQMFENPTPPSAAFGLTFGPNIDGYVLPTQPRVSFAAGTHNRVPVIVGTTKDEANYFMLLTFADDLLSLNLRNMIVFQTCAQRDARVTTNLGASLAASAKALYPCTSAAMSPTLSYAQAVTHAQYECPARRTLRALKLGQTEPVRRYWFTHAADFMGVFQNFLGIVPEIGAGHTYDVPFVFKSHDAMMGYWPSTRETNLGNAIQKYWRTFAATGDPNYSGGVNWPAYVSSLDNTLKLEVTGKTGSSDPGLQVVNGIDTSYCDFWDSNFTLDGWTGGGGSCTPSCSGKVCGSDGCGGSCGSCGSGTTCNAAQTACTSASSITIQAEAYTSQSGTGLETCQDTGGGQDVGWVEPGDYLEYANVNIPVTGSYTVSYRYATDSTTSSISLAVDGAIVATTALPPTGGWQTWTSVQTTVSLTAGLHTLRLGGSLYNLNYFTLTPGGGGGTCTPSCSGKVCGSDGCGGVCGTCGGGTSCNASGQCTAAGGGTKLTGVTYTQSDTYTSNVAATYSYMNDDNANGSTNNNQTGTNSGTDKFIKADAGSAKFITNIVVGYDYLNNLPGGWGVPYTEGLLVEGSTDNASWTSITTVPTYTSTGSTNGLATIPINGTYRYIRLRRTSGYACVLEFQLWTSSSAPPTGTKLTGVSYSQSDTYASNTAATYAYMNDGNANGSTNNNQTGTNSGTDKFIKADAGSAKFITNIVVGYDYLSNLPGGWGVSYTEGLIVEGSSNNSTWTNITTLPTYASTGSTNGLATIPINGTWRYIRLRRPSGYACALEFQLWTN